VVATWMNHFSGYKPTRFLVDAISEVQHPIRAVSRPEAVFLNY
jgi:hypothetical protein